LKKSIKIECVETLCAKKKDVPAVVKNEKLKKGKHCGQHPGDMEILE
jgi:hypothetical protein